MDLMALIGLGGCVIMRRLAFAFFAGSIVACSVVNTASAQFRMEFQASPQGGPPGGFGGPPPGGFGGGHFGGFRR